MTLSTYYKYANFTTAFEIHSSFFIIIPIRLKICRSNVFYASQGRICTPGKLPQWVCVAKHGKRIQLESCAEFAQACSLPELPYNGRGLEKFEKFRRKHQCQCLITEEPPTQMLLCKFGDIL